MSTISKRKIVTQNIYNGEKALRRFNSEFPYVCSNTQYNTIIERHKDDSRYEKLLPIIKGKSCLAGLKLDGIRATYKQTPDKINYLKKAVKFQKVANCQERSFLIHNELEQMGIKSQNIRLNFVPKNDKKISKNHAFTVIGLDNNAEINNPHTWGKNAVIVDAWANMVKRAAEGIEYIKTILKFNPEIENCEFSIHRNA